MNFVSILILIFLNCCFCFAQPFPKRDSIAQRYAEDAAYTGELNFIQQGDITYEYTENCRTYVVHEYRTTGFASFTAPEGVSAVDVLVVAAGGGGGTSTAYGNAGSGGGGSGGVVYELDYSVTPFSEYSIFVGNGGNPGATGNNSGSNGQNSIFSTLTALGGGGGRGGNGNGLNGGSGGGARGGTGGVATQPGSGSGGFGFRGGNSGGSPAGAGATGGGGAGGPGENLAGTGGEKGGNGGIGVEIDITGVPVYYAGGGGGGAARTNSPVGAGGLGGGGNGANNATVPTAGQANTGGGGGGGNNNQQGAAGGSGIVIVRYVKPDLSQQGDNTYEYTENGTTYVVHEYTTTGTGCSFTAPEGVFDVDVLVVAGGGGGGTSTAYGNAGSGGGGSGGVVYELDYSVAPSSEYSVFVGNGGNPGATGNNSGSNGQNSIFSTLTALGGGGGRGGNGNGLNGGSGGGARGGTGGVATQPGSGSGGFGFRGGNSGGSPGGAGATGGGGAGGPGENLAGTSGEKGGDGGIGVEIDITGVPVYYAGGGGGGAARTNSPVGAGGLGGGGNGANNATVPTAGQANTGGGGGGGNNNQQGAAGGSGIVIVRYVKPDLGQQGDITYEYTENCRTYVVHEYRTTGFRSFTAPEGVSAVDVLVVAAGGGGGTSTSYGNAGSGGGGAGGVVYELDYSVTPSSEYSIFVGNGGNPGATGNNSGSNGQNSIFSTLTALGGGGGRGGNGNGLNGGSGGGARGGTGGIATQPGSGSGGFGFRGGNSGGSPAGAGATGGGGAGGPGENLAGTGGEKGGDGGIGVEVDITGVAVYYAGGGGGGAAQNNGPVGSGGLGGGGNGSNNSTAPTAGQANTGGGGGGGNNNQQGAAGGSGIVIIKYFKPTIISVQDGDWSNPDTWNSGCIPEQDHFVIIDDNTTVTLDVDTPIENVVINPLGTLDFGSNMLTVNRNFDIQGSIIEGSGTLLMNGTSDQEISGDGQTEEIHNVIIDKSSGSVSLNNIELELNGTLLVQNGDFNITGGTFIVNSTSPTKNGNIGPLISGTITGEVRVRRFIAAGNSGYRDLSSSLNNIPLSHWDADFSMSGPGFPDGCAWGPGGCFASVKYFENNTWFDVTNYNHTLLAGRGYHIYLADDLNMEVYSGTTASVFGNVNTGSVVRNTVSGWSLVGNPFASNIDFSLLNRTGSVGNYFYVYDSQIGNFQWHDGDLGIGGSLSGALNDLENGIIAMGQGFWIDGAGSITMPQSAKVSTSTTFLRNSLIPNGFSLILSSEHSDFKCDASFFYDAEADAAFNLSEDIRHLKSLEEGAPYITSIVDDNEIRLNRFNSNSETLIYPLAVYTPNQEDYTISVKDLEYFDAYSCVYIIDTETGNKYNLKETGTFSFTPVSWKSADTRFAVVMTNNECEGMITEDEAAQTLEHISEDNINFVQRNREIDVAFDFMFHKDVTVQIINTMGQVVAEQTGQQMRNGQMTMQVPGSTTGMFFVRVNSLDQQVTKKFIVH